MTILILYDGSCGLCKKTMRHLRVLDWGKILMFVDFQNAAQRKKYAPDIPYEKLNRALHIRFPNGKTKMGFSALRALAWHIPLLLPLAPFLYIPGVKLVGDRVYKAVAKKRQKCTHNSCKGV